MNVEEAVLWLKRYQGYEPFENGTVLKHSFDLTDETVDVILSAISGTNIGEPLTLEQLRGMERPTPVWAQVETKTVEGWDGYWCICHRGHIITPGLVSMYADKMDGVTFYDYPPAHIDRDAWDPCGELCRNNCMTCDHNADKLFGDEDYCKDCHRYSKWESSVHKYCERCGRPKTPDAWAELEKRFRG